MAKTGLNFVAGYSAIEGGSWKEIYKRFFRTKSRNTVASMKVIFKIVCQRPETSPSIHFIARFLIATTRLAAFARIWSLNRSGKFRSICVPTVNDRIVQRATLNFLTAKYGARLANQISYGFIKGRTVYDAAERACRLREKHGWAFKTDISAFFDTVDRRLLHDRIAHEIRHRSLHRLLIEAANCEIENPVGTQKKRLADLGIKEGLGIRQGMPLSPFFANLFLEPLDDGILKAGFHAVRYADDLLFFADSKEQCEAFEGFCKESLDRLNLTIPNTGPGSKSVIVPPDEVVEFLGLGLRKNGIDTSSYFLKRRGTP